MLVSFPEAVLIAFLSIFSIGKFKILKNKRFFLNILIYAIISSVASYFIRRHVGNELESLMVHLIISSLLFIFILRMNFYESILAALFGLTILVVTESFSLLPVVAITDIDISAAKTDDFMRALLSIPQRIIQVLMIILSYRYKIKIIDMEGTPIKKKEYFVQLIVYIISIGTLVFLVALMTKLILLDQGNFMKPTNTILLRVNIYISLFVTVILTLAVRNTHEFYKNKNTLNNNEFLQNLEYISNLMDNQGYKDAKDAISNLKTHIKKQ